MSTTLEIDSIGRLAGIVQRHPSEIRRAADELNIPPALVINGVSHFDAQSCQRLAEYFRLKSDANNLPRLTKDLNHGSNSTADKAKNIATIIG
jgi:hypothetical protein